jgi:LysM repeat protein
MAYCPYSFFDYRMEAGETFASLAGKFKVAERVIIEHNKGMQPGAGRRIRIPCACGGCTKGAFYAIRKGESLLQIARRSGLDLTDLLRANPYLNPGYYIPGQVIVIPPARIRANSDTYTMEEGEGVFDVLRKFRMDFSTFCTLNPDLSPMTLKGGQTVKVAPRTETAKKGRWYTMEEGETLLSVAQRYGIPVSTLLGLNDHLRPSDFKEGARVRVPEKQA